jgi:hypothetical protein
MTTTEITRQRAIAILSEREGTPPEHTDHCRTEDLIAAAQAPEGQPCPDCGCLSVWVENDQFAGWKHTDPDSRCFLA